MLTPSNVRTVAGMVTEVMPVISRKAQPSTISPPLIETTVYSVELFEFVTIDGISTWPERFASGRITCTSFFFFVSVITRADAQ